MLVLSSKTTPLTNLSLSENNVFQIALGGIKAAIHPHAAYLIKDWSQVELGYDLYLCFVPPPVESKFSPLVLLPQEMNYLKNGDIIALHNDGKHLRTLYRRSSLQNSFLMTERCNHLCLMCSQPPRDIQDDHLIKEILSAIPLIYRGTTEIGLTGGEPTLTGEGFFQIVDKIKSFLPHTALHILSNGRTFVNIELCQRLADINHKDLMLGIPLYSDYAPLHNFVVQSENAFSETIQGIINLKSVGIKVEVRFVMHKYTASRLKEFADFVVRNLLFVDHIAFMGLETIGYAKSNLAEIWIDPSAYMDDLHYACETIAKHGGKPSIYNSQLCLIRSESLPYYRRSISDWKNEFMEACHNCFAKSHCCGFFASNKTQHSNHLKPFQSNEALEQFLNRGT